MAKQQDIWSMLSPKFKFTYQPIKLFEAFAGIGCQAMALKRLGIEYESVGISEIDKYAIQSYNAIHGKTKNYGDICQMIEIPQCDIFTWSFPCTDLSKAGKRKGMTENTRSGLVYEVLRLIRDSKHKPTVLIMENVPDLVQAKFYRQFHEIMNELESYGYSNFVKRLNAKNYGVAQNRDRVFMVSILGDYSYTFSNPIKLEKRLKDYLEDSVDEKYYLNDKMIKFFKQNSQTNEEKGNGFRFKPQNGNETAKAITTLAGNRMDDNFIKEPKLNQVAQIESKGFTESTGGVYSDKGLSPTIQTLQGGNREPKIVDKYSKRSLRDIEKNIIDLNGKANTITANPQRATINSATLVVEKLRIRKLTPKECWRLMGIDDEEFEKAQKVCSNSQLYKQAGNGIVVDVFTAILKGLF